MASPKLNDALIEYEFSNVEQLTAQILDPLKIIWLQTKYAQLMKLKASELMPEAAGLDRSYIMKLAEIEGKLNMIQELLDEHKQAINSLNELKQNHTQNGGTTAEEPVKEIAHAAGSRVHTG